MTPIKLTSAELAVATVLAASHVKDLACHPTPLFLDTEYERIARSLSKKLSLANSRKR